MSRVTIALAQEVAQAMLAERARKNAEFEKETQQIVHKKIMDGLPKELVDLFNGKYKDYVNVDSVCRLKGPGLEHNYFSLGELVFPRKNIHGHTNIVFEPDEAKVLEKRLADYSTEYRAIKDLIKKVEATLLDLKTFKRVEESFPEAFAFFPPKDKPVYLPANLDSLRANFK